MVYRIIKVSGCHNKRCGWRYVLRYYHPVMIYCHHPDNDVKQDVTKNYLDKTLPDNCPLENEITLKDLAIEDAGKLAEHIRDCAKQDAVKHIRAVFNKYVSFLIYKVPLYFYSVNTPIL